MADRRATGRRGTLSLVRGAAAERVPELEDIDDGWDAAPADREASATTSGDDPALESFALASPGDLWLPDALPAPVARAPALPSIDKPAEAVSTDPATPDAPKLRAPHNTVPPPTNYEKIRNTARQPAFDPSRVVTPRQSPKFILPHAARPPSMELASDLASGPTHVPHHPALTPPAAYAPRPLSTKQAEEPALDVVGLPRSPPYVSILIGAVVVAALGGGAFFVLSRSTAPSAVVAPTSSVSPSALVSALAIAPPTATPAEGLASNAVTPTGVPARITPRGGVRLDAPPRASALSSGTVAAAPSLPASAALLPSPPAAIVVPRPAPRASNVPPGMEFLKHDL